MIPADSPALGPVCVCSPWYEERGYIHPDCLVHAPWRCVVTGCPEPASDGGECVIHGRWRQPLSPWGVGEDGMSDAACDHYERNVLGL